MKKIVLICMAGMICGTAVAQKSIRIGNMLVSVRKTDSDSLITTTKWETKTVTTKSYSVNESGDTTFVTKTQTWTNGSPKSSTEMSLGFGPDIKFNNARDHSIHQAVGTLGFGAVMPSVGDNIYPLSGSFHFRLGGEYHFRPVRPLAFIGSIGYSFTTYKIRNIANYHEFTDITGPLDYDAIKREPFRTNNFDIGFHLRIYPVSKFFIDFGVQGDWAFKKRLVVKYERHGRDKFKDNYAFLPFYPSAIVRVGWDELAVFARYRFTEALNPKVFGNDLPPLTIGIMLL